MNCKPIKADDRWTCRRCGYAFKLKSANPPNKRCKVLGLGDKVEWVLSRLGITKARVSHVVQKFTRKPSCGCSQRQEALNELGDSFTEVTRKETTNAS